jgi:PhzF family phenazine biosynthesis protein
MKKAVTVFIIDTFTASNCLGNPTAVCMSNEPFDHEQSLSLAMELNFPVTAFLDYPGTNDNQFPVRYFTPTREIPACGHATLATVKVVADMFSIDEPSFKTKAGIVIQSRIRNDIVTMNYPKYELINYAVAEDLLQALKISGYESAGLCEELEAVFIELNDPLLLKTIQPDFVKLVSVENRITEVVLTSVADDNKYDFILRSFCPWIGIDEDPVTGSVHSVLGGYWQARSNKNKLAAYQASARGGEVYVTVLPDKVEIEGKVTLVTVKELQTN